MQSRVGGQIDDECIRMTKKRFDNLNGHLLILHQRRSSIVEGNGLKVKPPVKVHGGDDVLESGNDTLNSSAVLLFKSKGLMEFASWEERRDQRLCLGQS